MDTFGPIWSCMVLQAPVCFCLIMYGPIWPRVESCGPGCFLRVIMFAFVQLRQLLHKFCDCLKPYFMKLKEIIDIDGRMHLQWHKFLQYNIRIKNETRGCLLDFLLILNFFYKCSWYCIACEIKQYLAISYSMGWNRIIQSQLLQYSVNTIFMNNVDNTSETSWGWVGLFMLFGLH